MRQRVVLNDAAVLSKTGIKPMNTPAGHMPRRTYKSDSFPTPSKIPAGRVVRLFRLSILATSTEESNGANKRTGKLAPIAHADCVIPRAFCLRSTLSCSPTIHSLSQRHLHDNIAASSCRVYRMLADRAFRKKTPSNNSSKVPIYQAEDTFTAQRTASINGILCLRVSIKIEPPLRCK